MRDYTRRWTGRSDATKMRMIRSYIAHGSKGTRVTEDDCRTMMKYLHYRMIRYMEPVHVVGVDFKYKPGDVVIIPREAVEEKLEFDNNLPNLCGFRVLYCTIGADRKKFYRLELVTQCRSTGAKLNATEVWMKKRACAQ